VTTWRVRRGRYSSGTGVRKRPWSLRWTSAPASPERPSAAGDEFRADGGYDRAVAEGIEYARQRAKAPPETKGEDDTEIGTDQ
jgi:hypothetical protein